MPAICLYGPTGSGKTALALALASRFDVEIISVDSAMVFRHLDIGTAKPGREQRRGLPHHLIDVRDPWQRYSAGAFRDDALRAIGDITRRGRIALLVGGTMLYFRALWSGLDDLPAADPAVRAAIDAEATEKGWAALHADLARIDPLAAGRIRPTDRQRIQRALEVHRLTGSPISSLQGRAAAAGPQFFRIALEPADRQALYEDLDQRLAAMLAAGFIEEVRGLMAMPLMSAGAQSMRAVGYRQIWAHLAGDTDRTDAERLAGLATRHLAKRQLTWMRSEAADLTIRMPSTDAVDVVSRAMDAAGVSRRT
ncbi:MAG: tRNA (adenosine(37)-N6)-dimethylallyltransferase MiaA [Gammaproteobacteria bacterium]|nr:tRNA (adenosine(37)-N6)-dimethylallyltransferase MiaA [Gammaproteobacteria bacterium]